MQTFKLHSTEYINLQATLFSGQIFSFHHTNKDEFTGMFDNNPIVFIQDNLSVFYKHHKEIQNELSDFFNLNTNYTALFSEWNKKQSILFEYDGLRLLKYDFTECIFSFICSTNNNIARISKMVKFLYSKGQFIGEINGVMLHKFPVLNKIEELLEELKENKFGYRAEYVIDAACFLKGFKKAGDYEKDFNNLQKIKGVGRKVADCVCLMGLGYKDAIPIDTHVFKEAKKIFGIEGALNKGTYNKIGSAFSDIFQPFSGIAQLYIFRKSVENRKIGARKIELKPIL